MAIHKSHKEQDAFHHLWDTPANELEKNVGRFVEAERGCKGATRIVTVAIIGTQFIFDGSIAYRVRGVSEIYFNDYSILGYVEGKGVTTIGTKVAGTSYPVEDTYGFPLRPSDILEWV